MIKQLRILVFLGLLTVFSVAQDWYVPDSNLISDKQFESKIVGDKLSFKFVKYFTPHCPYCRYLKAVFDQLKHTKEWCFKIYDFNCQQYPQFCMSNVRSGSFPYTAIHDQNGVLVEQIHGFYPEPIISTVFDKIQERCQAARSAALPQIPQASLPEAEPKINQQPAAVPITEQPVTITPTQVHQEIQSPSEQKINVEAKAGQHEVKQQSSTSQNVKVQEQKKDEKPNNSEDKVKKDQQVPHNNGKEQAQQQKGSKQQLESHHEHLKQKVHQAAQHHAQKNTNKESPAHQQSHHQKKDTKTDHSHESATTSYHNYIFYGVCLLCAGYYVYSLHSNQQSTDSKPQVKTVEKQTSKTQERQVEEPQMTMEQSELLKQLPDEEL